MPKKQPTLARLSRPQLAKLTKPRLHMAVSRGLVTGAAGRLWVGDRDSLAPKAPVCGYGHMRSPLKSVNCPIALVILLQYHAHLPWGPRRATASRM